LQNSSERTLRIQFQPRQVGAKVKTKKPQGAFWFLLERVAGIEPASPAWKAGVISRYTTRALFKENEKIVEKNL
jgi:hypothetical protein